MENYKNIFLKMDADLYPQFSESSQKEAFIEIISVEDSNALKDLKELWNFLDDDQQKAALKNPFKVLYLKVDSSVIDKFLSGIKDVKKITVLETEDSKEDILRDLKESFGQIKGIKSGTVKSRNFMEFIDELRH